MTWPCLACTAFLGDKKNKKNSPESRKSSAFQAFRWAGQRARDRGGTKTEQHNGHGSKINLFFNFHLTLCEFLCRRLCILFYHGRVGGPSLT